LGALGVVPRYCAVMVREPAVVGIQASEADDPPKTFTSPSTVLEPRNTSLKYRYAAEPHRVASLDITTPAEVFTKADSVWLVPTVIVSASVHPVAAVASTLSLHAALPI